MWSPMAKLKVGIYHVAIDQGKADTVPNLFRHIETLPDDHSRTVMLSDEPIRPRRGQIKFNPEYCLVDFSRIRQIGELPLSDIHGAEDKIVFEPGGKHPAERTAILFDAQSSCLFVHEHAGGISAAAFGRYFSSVGNQANGTPMKVKVDPVLKHEALLRFAKQKHHTRIKVRLAGMDDTSFLEKQGEAAKPLLSMINFFGAPVLKVEASIGAAKEEPAPWLSNIGETVTALLGLRSTKQLKQLVVLGHEDGEAADFPVDFIKDRITFTWEVESVKQRVITDAERYRAVTEAWRANQAELRDRFRHASSDAFASG